MTDYIFESLRLGFRLWKESDKKPFSEMNANEDVMRYFPKILDRSESDGFIARIQEHFQRNGYGLWAVELKDTKEFIGFIGFNTAVFQAEFTPCVEIGWRLANQHWNKGYATEGAKACLEYGYKQFDLDQIYSFTSSLNQPSVKVMSKIGLRKIGEFEHPRIEEGNPLRSHVLYKIDKKEYESKK